MKKIDFATLFLQNGISIIPLQHRGKKPESILIGGAWEQYQTQQPTEYDVNRWLGSNWLNYGVIAGWQNLVIIDFDDIEYFNVWQLWALEQHSIIRYAVDNSFKVKTSRGVHVYVTTLETTENGKRIKKKGGIDIQAQRKFVVGPMCTHPSGHIYQPMNDNFIFPIVDEIQTILPLDLFPAIIAEPETGSMPAMEITPLFTEYDPFAAASGHHADFDLITRVKQSVRIENFFPDRIKTSNDGRWWACKCPFHIDDNPSFWIDTRRQLCGCQSCGMKPMDVINLYARMHNVSESLAVTNMAQKVGVWG